MPEHIETLRQYTQEIPVKVGALANALGLKVVVASLPLNISGLIKPNDNGSFIIKVNRFEPKPRQRFTIAHEIAHYLLHRDKINAGVVDSVLYRSKLSSRTEAEANRLAADIVMPKSRIIDSTAAGQDKFTWHEIEELADRFQVSRQAMEIRVGA